MYHKAKLSAQEKIKLWLSLCDFPATLIEDNFGKEEFQKRLEKMRETHVRVNHSMLKGLSRVKR